MALDDVQNPNSLSAKFRRKRDVKLRGLIEAIANERGAVTILDIGGTVGYWRRLGCDFLRAHKAHVVVTNFVASELTDLGGDGDIFEQAVANGCDLSEFGDASFDLAHSNSVIEHVGDWRNMKAFAAETRRVGRAYYVQTPNFWFPVDPHYYKFPIIHWLPRPVRARLFNSLAITHSGRIPTLDMAYQVIDDTRLLDGGQFRFLFSDAEISSERVAGLSKSYIAIRR